MILSLTRKNIIILITIIAVAGFFIYYATAGIFKTNTQVVNDLTSGLVGYWTFDGQDMDWSTHTATDVSTNSYNCALDSKYSTSTSPVSGVIGQALDIGNRAVATCGDINEIDGVAHITVSLWLKYSNYQDDDVLLVKSNTFNLTHGGSGYGDGDDLIAWIDNGATYGWTTGNIISNLLDEWHHIVVVYDGDQSGDNAATLKIYLDNVQQDMSFVGTIPSTSGNTANVFNIGKNGIGLTPTAYADEVRIYNRTLSASEITELYNQGVNRLAEVNINQKTNIVGDGLVGYWTFDGQDIDWGTNTVNDLSGNGNNGTMTDISTTTEALPGIIGQSLFFDGDDDWVSRASADLSSGFIGKDSGDSDYTMSAWVYLDGAGMGTSRAIASKSNPAVALGWVFFVNGSNVLSATALVPGFATAGTALSANRWYHVLVTYDASASELRMYLDGVLDENGASNPYSETNDLTNNAIELRMGAIGSGALDFKGQIDEFRIYNRILSSSEITELYNQGAEKLLKVNMPQTDLIPNGLVGYWTFDGQDTDWGANKTNDLSGNSNTGTMTNISTSTDAVGGVAGQALNFYESGAITSVVVPDDDSLDITGALTISVWIYPESTVALQQKGILTKNIVNANGYSMSFDDGTDCVTKSIFFKYGGSLKGNLCTSADVITLNEWNHVVYTSDATSNSYIYINGVQKGTTSHDPFVQGINTNDVYIGQRGTSFGDIESFDGKIDEVRIYNRTLSAGEAKELYMAGAGR